MASTPVAPNRTAIVSSWPGHSERIDGFCEAIAGEAWDELWVVIDGSERDPRLADRIEAVGGRLLQSETDGLLGGVGDAVAATHCETLIFLGDGVRRKRPGWVAHLKARIEPGMLCGQRLRARLGVRYVDGWCLGIRRADWNRLGGHDPNYETPSPWPDVDLGFRAARLGMEVRRVDCGLEHDAGGVIPAASGPDPSAAAASSECRDRDRLARAIEATGARPALDDRELPGINFFGPISGNMGLGVAARNWLRFLLDAGLHVFAADTPDRRGRSGHSREFLPMTHGLDEPSPHGINLFSMNPWSFRKLVAAGHRAVELEGRVNVIVPFWELMTVPEDWRAGLEAMDLVVAPTRFIAEAIRGVELDAEVVYVPQPFETGEVGEPDRAHWDTPEDAFLVVAGFELSSDIERKNPWALLEAFAQAFPNEPRARLILKLNNARRWSPSDGPLSLLIETCARDPRIRLLVDVLPYREVLSLYATADVYVSLHRAEGLGLGMLEAMSLGTPVISTGWSGNLDYMTPENSFLVDYRMVPVRASTLKVYSPEVLGPDARWAEPDPVHAADCLRRLAADPALGRCRSERALADLARRREASEPSALLAALQRLAGRERV